MSEGMPEPGNVGSGTEGNNPAWNDLLGVIPQEVHEQVIPHLKNWDSGVEQKFQQYAPYKSFIENNVNVDELQTGYGILQALNEDPKKVYEAIAEHYGLGSTIEEIDDDPDPGALPPEIMEKLQGFEKFQEQVSQLLVSQKEQELIKAAEVELETELSDLSKKYGEFDEQIVIPLMQSGMKAEDAVKRYFTLMDQIATKKARPTPPNILGGNAGGVPAGGVDPRKLSNQETRNLVANYLAARQD